MTFESDTDRLAYLETCGRAMSLSDTNGSGWPVYGVYSYEYVEVQGIEATRPAVLVRESDLANPSGGLPAVEVGIGEADGGDFPIVGRQPDGAGMVLLIMDKT